MAAVTQIRCRHSKGRAYYEKKLAEGKTPKEALRALKRQVSDAIYAALQAGARKAAAQPGGPGRATGGGSHPSAAGSPPRAPALRESHSRASRQPTAPPATPADPALALSRTAADPSERAGGARTGRSPAAQRRPKGVLDPPAREPIMPGSGKGRQPARHRAAAPSSRRAHAQHHLDSADAAELAEMLSFPGHRPASHPGRLSASPNAFAGNPAYGIQQLRDDIDRLVFLPGGSDGEEPFSGDHNEPPG
jgi:hypothetical protein